MDISFTIVISYYFFFRFNYYFFIIYSIFYTYYFSFNSIYTKLSFEDSCIFELRYNGFSYKEISELLDIPVSTIDGRLSKIRVKLKEIL